MGVFDLFRVPDIHQGVEEQRTVSESILLDVRSEGEYRSGHIPGSKNIPLHTLDKIRHIAQNRSIPLYVYCRSGARSRRAAAMLQHMGYKRVKSIGGIAAWRGKVER